MQMTLVGKVVFLVYSRRGLMIGRTLVGRLRDDAIG
jgi:hypothetical protein